MPTRGAPSRETIQATLFAAGITLSVRRRKPLKLPKYMQPPAKGCVDCGAACDTVLCDACGAKGVKPKTKRSHPEDDLHLAVAHYLRLAIGEAGVTNAQGVRWISHAPEHKGHAITTRNGKRIYLAGKRARAKGARPGEPDIEIVWRAIGHRIELKEPGRRNQKNGGLSDDQVIAHRNLRAAGVPVAVCYTVDEVDAALRGWGIPLHASLS